MHQQHSDASLRNWYAARTYRARADDLDMVIALRKTAGATVSVVLPALNEETTIGPICERVTRLVKSGLVQQLLVLDSGSADLTATRARAEGAEVFDVATILPELPQVTGKGEALWRSLAVVSGDIVVYLDSDVSNFKESYVVRLVEPLLEDPTLAFVKGFYDRPLASETSLGGGRVTELMARPLLNLLYPELGGFIQPLSGEYAARTAVLRRLPFFGGYGVEIGLLIDLLAEVGLDAMAQVDLGARMHRNRPTAELGSMAFEILRTVLVRAETDGRIKLVDDLTETFVTFRSDEPTSIDIPLVEREPMDTYVGGSGSNASLGTAGAAEAT